MKHYLFTRATYHPEQWDLEANRRRLVLFFGVTVRSLAAQTCRNWEWVLGLSPNDQLREERLEAARRANVVVHAIDIPLTRQTRSGAAVDAYQGPWCSVVAPGGKLTTRLDDDDAFIPTAFDRIQHHAAEHLRRGTPRHSLMLPVGFRVWGGRFTRVSHGSNAMSTLWTPGGDDAHVYTFMHRDIAKHVPVHVIDSKPAWLWVRHDDSLSGWKKASAPITKSLIDKFPVDWSLIGTKPIVESTDDGRHFS